MTKIFQVSVVSLLVLVAVLQVFSILSTNRLSSTLRFNPRTSNAFAPSDTTSYGWDYLDPQSNTFRNWWHGAVSSGTVGTPYGIDGHLDIKGEDGEPADCRGQGCGPGAGDVYPRP